MDEVVKNERTPGFPESRDAGPAAASRHMSRNWWLWETYIRCLFLAGVLFLIGFLAWRPSQLRLSELLSFAHPSRGESLAWRAEDEFDQPLRPAYRQLPPDEWRLGPNHTSAIAAVRPSAPPEERVANRVAAPASGWRRISFSPWQWQDDVRRPLTRSNDEPAPPPQKSATSFRVGDIAEWPAPVSLPAAPQPGAIPLPALPVMKAVATETPTLALPALPSVQPPAEKQRQPAPAVAAPAAKPETVDWKNREIAEPIPGAYLTIYPKLKFVGLCVPGQGYVRKYNQVGVPRDAEGEKSAAQDGKAPYGKYYVAARRTGETDPALVLSWPSPEDAKRAGLDAAARAEIESAWRGRTLPPQDTAAGGGVELSGAKNPAEFTDGGFSLSQADMLEILTALPDKAWVLVQK